jgi:hypothetical protein
MVLDCWIQIDGERCSRPNRAQAGSRNPGPGPGYGLGAGEGSPRGAHSLGLGPFFAPRAIVLVKKKGSAAGPLGTAWGRLVAGPRFVALAAGPKWQDTE